MGDFYAVTGVALERADTNVPHRQRIQNIP